MSYRPERVAHVVRDVVSEAIAGRISDPRVHRFTSVTRVEMSADLRYANVYVSVMGTDIEGRTTMKGLESAVGMIQTMLARRLDMRTCPILKFHLDRGLKIAIETIRRIDEVITQEHGNEPLTGEDSVAQDDANDSTSGANA